MAALCFTQQNLSIEVRRRTWTSGEVVGSTLMLVGLLGWPSHYLTLVRRGSGILDNTQLRREEPTPSMTGCI